MRFFVVKLKFRVISCEKMHMISILVRYGYRVPSKPISHSNGYHMHIISYIYILYIEQPHADNACQVSDGCYYSARPHCGVSSITMHATTISRPRANHRAKRFTLSGCGMNHRAKRFTLSGCGINHQTQNTRPRSCYNFTFNQLHIFYNSHIDSGDFLDSLFKVHIIMFYSTTRNK